MPNATQPPPVPTDDEAHLKVLRALAQQPDLSQRELARELGISLGKTNYCLNALIDRGWVKAQNFRNSKNKLAYAYLLTPNGLEAKLRITARFLERKRAEYDRLRAEIDELSAEVAANRPKL